MIKVDGNVIYLTCGETSFSLRVDDGKLVSSYFGGRVEPEDDLASLGCLGGDEFFIDSGRAGTTPSDGDFERNVAVDEKGKRIDVDFRFVSAAVVDKREFDIPSLRGEKTLLVKLADSATGLIADLHYTPYTRGGIARRVEVRNGGGKTLRFRAPSARLELSGEYSEFSCGDKTAPLNFIGLKNDAGEAYGMLTFFGGDCVCVSEELGGAIEAVSTVDKTFVLEPGEWLSTPETLIVRSDNGTGGMMRIFHDIICEYAIPKRFADHRRRVPLYFSGDVEDARLSAELGAEVLVTPVDGADDKRALELAAECKRLGMEFGAELDMSKPAAQSADYIISVIQSTGAEYIAVKNADKSYEGRLRLYSALAATCEKFPDLAVEGDCDPALLMLTPLFGRVSAAAAFGKTALCLVVPPCALCRTVTGGASPKTEFDISSVGRLGYSLDAKKLPPPARLAVRAQIFSYQDDSPLVVSGDFYGMPVRPDDFGVTFVSKDKSKAYAVYYKGSKGARVRFDGLDIHNLYRVRETDCVLSGAALRYIGLPVPDGLKSGDTLSFHLRQVADYD